MANVIGRLAEPRMRLIKALCNKKYGDRHHTSLEMNTVIAENAIHLYRANGNQRSEKQIQDAMSVAHKKLKNALSEERELEMKYGEHIITSPHS
jgi:hypothetical protein